MKKSGEIAIFTGMILVLVMTLLFTAIEGARISCAGFYLKMASDAAAQSCFGEYYLPLWEDYSLLFYYEDESIGSRMEEYLDIYADAASNGAGVSFLGYSEAQVSAESVYITDNEGQAFYDEAVDHATIHLPAEMLESLLAQADLLDDIEDVTDLMGDLENFSSEALLEVDALAKADEEAEDGKTAGGISSGLLAKAGELEEQVFEVASRYDLEAEIPDTAEADEDLAGSDTASFPSYSLSGMAEDAWLSYLTGGADISDAEVYENDVISGSLSDSEDEDNENTGLAGRVSGYLLFREYLLDQFSGYSSVKENHALSYEWEYLLGGKDSDKSNLVYALNRILMLRSGINFLENLMDKEKKSEAMALALAVSGLLGAPQAIRLIQLAILAIWAANDAVTDVKTLLAGNKVPLMELSGTQYLELDYKGYIRLLLYMKSTNLLQRRGLDILQTDMMDTVSSADINKCVYSSEFQITAKSKALFTGIFSIGGSASFTGVTLSASGSGTYAASLG